MARGLTKWRKASHRIAFPSRHDRDRDGEPGEPMSMLLPLGAAAAASVPPEHPTHGDGAIEAAIA